MLICGPPLGGGDPPPDTNLQGIPPSTLTAPLYPGHQLPRRIYNHDAPVFELHSIETTLQSTLTTFGWLEMSEVKAAGCGSREERAVADSRGELSLSSAALSLQQNFKVN